MLFAQQIPVLYRNGKVDPNAKRKGDLEFVTPNVKSHDAFAVRYQSTDEKYYGPLSKYSKIIFIDNGYKIMANETKYDPSCFFC